MYVASLLFLLMLGGVLGERSSKKPVRAAAIDADPQPTPAATRVPVNYDPAPYSTLFRPENLDLTGFFGPQFVNTKHLSGGVDVKSLYAQFGSPHQHFAFTFPSKGGNRLHHYQQPPTHHKQRVVQQQTPHHLQVPLPVQAPAAPAPHKQQASEEFSQYYAQATPADFAPHPQQHQQQQYQHHAAPQPQQYPAAPQPQQYPAAPQQYPKFQFQLAPHPPSAYAVRPQHQQATYAVQPQVETRPQQQQQDYQQAYPPQAAYPSQAPPPAESYGGGPQQPQSDAYQTALHAAQKPTKVDLHSVIQAQVLPQLKDAQGIQLLDLSEFYPQKKGQKPTYFQVHPSEDFKSASFTPVELSSFYQQQQQKSPVAIPAAAIREPTLSVEELSALLQKQNGGFQPILNPVGPSQQPPSQYAHHQQHPPSYAYVQSTQAAPAPPHHHRQQHQQQQQANIQAYYAQAQRPSAGNIVYGSHPSSQQYAVHDHVPQQQPATYFAPQASVESSEEAAPSISPPFRSTVAKPVKRGPKPTQLAHIASPMPSPTPNPTVSSKPSKIRQLVKKPHLYGQGYSFELSG